MKLRVAPTAASALPDDRPRVVDPADPAAPVAVEPWGAGRSVVHFEPGDDRWAWFGVDRPAGPTTPRTIEVVVAGWRFELEVEADARAALRERATRAREGVTPGGPLEIRAIIPGRVASVAVVAGDQVTAGDTLLVVEAMKMQNELRAPRDGTVERVPIAAGQTIELGDVLVVLG